MPEYLKLYQRRTFNLYKVLIFSLMHSFAAECKRVPKGGLEPPRPCGQRILSPVRLPIPPLGQLDYSST